MGGDRLSMTQSASTFVAERQQKDRGIESLRGVAILLMVAGHVIGASAEQGLRVPDDTAWRFFYEALEDLRMPLFTTLSGFVYAYRPVRAWAGVRTLLRGKSRRLLVPLLVVGTAFFLVKMYAPGTNEQPQWHELWLLPLFSYEHLWFLQAIFLCFAVAAMLGAASMIDDFARWAATTAVAVVLFVAITIPDGWNLFSIDGALRLLPFFLLGYGVHQFGGQLVSSRVLAVAGAAFLPLYALRLWTITAGVELAAPIARGLSVSIAALLMIVLLGARARVQVGWLAWLGGFSFGIYLLHVFGAAGMRVAARAVGVEGAGPLFVLGLAAAMLAPIMFERTAGRARWVSWAVLGQRPQR